LALKHSPYGGEKPSVLDRSQRKYEKMGALPRHRLQLYQRLDVGWPLKSVTVTSYFGYRGGRRHEGIDFLAPIGTPVIAAHAGEVIYSGNGITGYGNMVVIRHPSGLSSVYAHHERNLVRRGQFIRRGQTIAYSGNTGRSTAPHLHFEMRDGADPFDPMLVLRRTLPQKAQQRRRFVRVD
jgi:murein DD-endopeptidase MepM/ murein hydrolase activator NlpD